MSKQVNEAERMNQRVLVISAIFTVIFTAIALTVGFITASQVILFDGIFNLVGIALTYLSISAIRFIKKKDAWNYPFGKATFEPFIAIVQYAIILYVCVSNITTAVGVILAGGHQVDIASGVMYGIFSTVYNLGVFTYLRTLTKKHHTAISDVEVDQWKFSFLLGTGILIGFSVSYVLSLTQHTELSAYADPILTIIITVIFGKTAILSMKKCIRELLGATPSQEITDFVTDKIAEIDENYEFSNEVFRLGKIGNKLVIELDYVIEPGSKLDTIVVQDQLRKEITTAFKELPYEKWINVNFTGDMTFAEHTS